MLLTLLDAVVSAARVSLVFLLALLLGVLQPLDELLHLEKENFFKVSSTMNYSSKCKK